MSMTLRHPLYAHSVLLRYHNTCNYVTPKHPKFPNSIPSQLTPAHETKDTNGQEEDRNLINSTDIS